MRKTFNTFNFFYGFLGNTITIITGLAAIGQLAGLDSCPSASRNAGITTILILFMLYTTITVGVTARRFVARRSGYQELLDEGVTRGILIFQILTSLLFFIAILFAAPFRDLFWLLESYTGIVEFDYAFFQIILILAFYSAVIAFCNYASEAIHKALYPRESPTIF